MSDDGTSPRLKRLKLGESDEENNEEENRSDIERVGTSDRSLSADGVEETSFDEDSCPVCLQHLLDRTVIPECSHEFCFDCILTWTNQSRRCPLCTRTIGPYIIHNIRSNFDYQKYHLPPLRTSPLPVQHLRRIQGTSTGNYRRQTQERWGRRERRNSVDELDRAIRRRKWVYRNDLFAKHVASNTITRYRPLPTPTQFAASTDHIRKATVFIRRELHVWVNLDIEFLTTFIISMLRAIDLRSESSVKLVAEFLDIDIGYQSGRRFPNAEHFIHELSCFLRSPYKNLAAWDTTVQYDIPYGYEGANTDRQNEARGRGTRDEDTRRRRRTSMMGRDRRDSAHGRVSSVHHSETLSDDCIDDGQTAESNALPSPSSRPWNQATGMPEKDVPISQRNHKESGESCDGATASSTEFSLLRAVKATDRALVDSDSKQPETETDRKGKQRQVSSERSAGVTTTTSQDYLHRDNGLEGTGANIASTNYALDREHKLEVASDQDPDKRPRSAAFHQFNRIRSSLLIAQAHLSQSNASASASDGLTTQHNYGREREALQPNSTNSPPSLLARLSDGPTKQLPEHGLSRRDNYTIISASDHPRRKDYVSDDADVERAGAAKDLRSKLLARVRAERALAEAVSVTETTTIDLTPESAQLDNSAVGQGTNNDARARLLAKLAAVKETCLKETLSRGERRGAGVTIAGLTHERRGEALRAELASQMLKQESSSS